MRQTRAFLILLFLSWVMFAQRPTFKLVRLTKDGPVVLEYWGDELLVKFRIGFGPQSTSAKSGIRQASATTLRSFAVEPQMDGYYAISYIGTVQTLQAMREQLANDPAFEWVSFSPVFHAYSNDPLFYGQWQLAGSFPGAIGWNQLSRLHADHVYVVVADTGACFGHEDFDWSRNFWNFNVFEPSKPAADDNGHGCAVASVIAAQTDNGKGIAGLADWVKFGFVKVLDKEGRSDAKTIAEGILAVARKTYELKRLEPLSRVILNLSFGSAEEVPPVMEAVQVALQAGVIVVAAAGNSALNIDRIKVTPASTPGVIAVGAHNWDNAVGGQGFWASNWGPKTVLLAAPGQDIMVAVPKGAATDGELYDPTGYRRLDGTSLSAPHVVGAIALMLAKFPEMLEDQIRIRLMNGNRSIKPWRLNSREYSATELFVSGARLSLEGLLVEDRIPPARPYIEVVKVGHSSAQILFTGTGDDGTDGTPFGARCLYSTIQDVPRLIEAVPYFGQFSGRDLPLTLRGPDNSPLLENSDYRVFCQAVDKAGNWSELSEPVEFHSAESQTASPIDLYGFSVQPGWLESEVVKWNEGRNPLLWHLTDFFSSRAWYAGVDEQFNYRAGVSDSEIISQEIDLRAESGSVSLHFRQFLQMLGYGTQGSHYDAAEIRIKSLADDGRISDKIVAESIPNTKGFGLEDYALDLSEYVGQRIFVSFRFFTNGSSLGIGWIINDVQLKTDR
jgi:subtilisin family serine protease